MYWPNQSGSGSVGIILLLNFACLLELSHAAPLPDYYQTRDCQPCQLAISPMLPGIDIRYQIVNQPPESRWVKAIILTSNAKPAWSQTLPVIEMLPVEATDEFFIGVTDLNFDGNNDLYFITSRGVANAYADYWLFDPAATKFTYLGNYPLLNVNKTNRTITAYQRGGHGGMIYESTKYAFINNALTVVEVEKQEASATQGIYI